MSSSSFTSSIMTSSASSISSMTSMASRTTLSAMSSGSSTTSSAASASSSGSSGSGNGPTSSPLLFFVALGFGVVFTNLWIIVGVKYCFRYNQRNRALRAAAEGEPIDLANMPRPHRRRREKKLMTMEEVNERFPLGKYKTWRAAREQQGLPAAGGITAPPSRAASLRDVDAVAEARKSVEASTRRSADTARPPTAASDPVTRTSGIGPRPATAPESSSIPEVTEVTHTPKQDSTKVEVGKSDSEKEKVVVITTPDNAEDTALQAHRQSVGEADMSEEDDDPIQAADAEVLAQPPGDTCAICLDSLDDEDDVRGLTCGHAFHAACLDPWLTSRRACCPLCKADYYVPKPRPEGDPTTASAGGAGPPTGWLGSRYMSSRPRMMLMAGRGFGSPTDRRARTAAVGTRRPTQNVIFNLSGVGRSGSNEQPEAGGQPTSHPSWRTRLHRERRQSRQATTPALPSFNFFRRGNATATATPATPAQLEAGQNTMTAPDTTTPADAPAAPAAATTSTSQ